MVYSYLKLGSRMALWTDRFLVCRLAFVDIFKGEVQVIFGFWFCVYFFFFSNTSKLSFLPSGEQIYPVDSASCLRHLRQ